MTALLERVERGPLSKHTEILISSLECKRVSRVKEAVLRETYSNTYCGGVYGYRFVIGVNTGWAVCDIDPERYS